MAHDDHPGIAQIRGALAHAEFVGSTRELVTTQAAQSWIRALAVYVRHLLEVHDKTMAVLAPSMPENGLEDAARQVRQVAVSNEGLVANLERELAEARDTLAEILAGIGGDHSFGDASRKLADVSAARDALAQDLAEARARIKDLEARLDGELEAKGVV